MTNAAAERGNYLDDLGDSLNNVSMSASNYLSQAKNAAVSFTFPIPDDFTLFLRQGDFTCKMIFREVTALIVVSI